MAKGLIFIEIDNIDIDIEERSQGKKIQLETLINHSKERVESKKLLTQNMT